MRWPSCLYFLGVSIVRFHPLTRQPVETAAGLWLTRVCRLTSSFTFVFCGGRMDRLGEFLRSLRLGSLRFSCPLFL